MDFFWNYTINILWCYFVVIKLVVMLSAEGEG